MTRVESSGLTAESSRDLSPATGLDKEITIFDNKDKLQLASDGQKKCDCTAWLQYFILHSAEQQGMPKHLNYRNYRMNRLALT